MNNIRHIIVGIFFISIANAEPCIGTGHPYPATCRSQGF
jgi:hypothetical protein